MSREDSIAGDGASHRWGDGQQVQHGAAARLLHRGRLIRLALLVMAAWGFLIAGWLGARVWQTKPPNVRGVLPGEFEPCEALLMAWHDSLTPGQSHALVDVMAKAAKRVQVCILVSNPRQQATVAALLRQADVPEHAVRFWRIPAPVNSHWTRDYGPLTTKSFLGGCEFLDFVYYSADSVRENDDRIPQLVTEALGIRATSVPLVLDGGNVLSNGAGLCVSSEQTLEWNPDHTSQQVVEVFQQYFGANECVLLEPLAGEPTGHVDMFCTFMAHDTVVVGAYDPQVDPVNAALLDRNAWRLAQVRTPCGPLNVVRIPMPPRRGKRWWTYTNVVYANGLLLVPSYPVSAALEEQVLATYQRLLPHWEIASVDAEPLMERNGSLHCATLNLYRLPQRSP